MLDDGSRATMHVEFSPSQVGGKCHLEALMSITPVRAGTPGSSRYSLMDAARMWRALDFNELHEEFHIF